MNRGKINQFWIFTLFAVLLSNCKEAPQFYSNVLRSDVFVQVYDQERFDFLWVFDNSGSMKPRRDFVRDNMQTFLDTLNSRKAIDFQMAVVTTDMFSHNGDLVQGAGGIEVVKSAESANPVADFASIVNNVIDSPTSFWEQGLESAYQGILKHKAKFSREGVPLIIIFLTDEEDYSCSDDCFGVEPENNPNWTAWPTDRYINYFANLKKSEESNVHVFNIVGLENSPCDVASSGGRYIEVLDGVTEKLDGLGVSGSICNSELGDSYQNIAQIISDRGVLFPLSSTAADTGINVFVDQVHIPFSDDNYIFDQENNSIIFTGAIPKKGSLIEVTYSQLTE